MKCILLLTLLLASTSCISYSVSHEDSSDPSVVEQVDINKYSGKWYEIGRYPSFFQRNCVSSTAEYQVLPDNSLSVHNICYREDRSTSDIKGTAKIANVAVPAKLKVRFNLFAKGDYWIIALDPNYQWAVVSSAKKSSLFILARRQTIESTLKSKILDDLKKRGFVVEKIIYDRY